MRIRKWPYWGPVLTGLLVGTSYIPFPPWASAFALTPLWVFFLRHSDWRQQFWAGWIAQFVFTLIGFNWIPQVALEFGGLPRPMALGAGLLFAAVMHLYYPLVLALTQGLSTRFGLGPAATLFVGVCGMNLAEHHWPMLFPWNQGYPWMAASLDGAQWADTIGVLGLSLLTHAVSAWIAYEMIYPHRRRAVAIGSAVVVFVIGMSLTGRMKKRSWEATNAVTRVLLVQANTGNIEKLFAETGAGYLENIVQKHLELTANGLETNPLTDLVIWPETAYPSGLKFPPTDDQQGQKILDFFRSKKMPFVIGALNEASNRSGATEQYNALFAFDSRGEPVASPYNKTYLLPYAEYTPFADDGFERGPGPTVIQAFGQRWGLQICYEGLDASFSRQLAQNGAQLLLNLTSDSWFRGTQELIQHFEMTRARAIETRRPLIRATSTGISATVLATGDVIDQTAPDQPATLYSEVRFLSDAPLSFYARWGGWLSPLLAALIAVALFWPRRSFDQMNKH